MDDQNTADAKFKFNGTTNLSKLFGFHISSKNTRISVVVIKKLLKRRENITNYIRKKSLRRKSVNKQNTKSNGDNVIRDYNYDKQFKTINPEEFTRDRKWCWDQYKQNIGVPDRYETNPKVALTYLRTKRHLRLVKETRNLRQPRDPKSVLLVWDNPINKCLCPDKECFLHRPTKEVTWRYLRPFVLIRWFPVLRKLQGPEQKSRAEGFIDKLVVATRGLTENQKGQEGQEGKEGKKKKKGMIILNRDLCVRRCLYYHIKEELQFQEYRPAFLLPTGVMTGEIDQEKDKKQGLKMSDIAPPIIEEKDDRVCNDFSCTVSTQTEPFTSGELKIKKFSHLLFSNSEETYLPDIRGQKLQITHYKHVSSVPDGPNLQVCVRNMEKLLDVKEMKFRFSKFLSSICEIKDPGMPVRTCSTQVPWRQRIYDSIKYRAPNRCGDKDFENIQVVPWTAKIDKYLQILQETKKEEEFEVDENGEVCPCCELFVESVSDKETLLEDIRDVLTLPGDVRILKSDIRKNQLADKKVDKIADKNKNEVLKVIKSGREGNEESDSQKDRIERCPHLCCDEPIKQKQDNTDIKSEGNDNINKQLDDKENVDKNVIDTNEPISGNDNFKPTSSFKDGELPTGEISNKKISFKCDFLRRKKSNVTKSTESVSELKMSNNNVANEEQNKSDKNVHEVNSTYKKPSNAFSSLFKWLYDQRSSLLSQIKKTSLNSKGKSSTENTKLNEGDSKASEREVFSMRYTSSTLSSKNSTRSGLDK